MVDRLPLLVFPQARVIPRPKGKSSPPNKPHFPGHERQIQRLTPQLDDLRQEFDRYKASVSGTVGGLEPEMVLVIEIAGNVDDFQRAIDATEGLEWLGEWDIGDIGDIGDIEPDDDFYEPIAKIGVDFFKGKIDGITNRKQSKEIQGILKEHGFLDDEGKIIQGKLPKLSLPDHLAHLLEDILQAIDDAFDTSNSKKLAGRLFLSFANDRGMRELLSLWGQWKEGGKLPRGKTKWRDVFNQTLKIRRWGMEEALYETGMIEYWRDLIDPILPDQKIHFQIELFYRQNPERRKKNEEAVSGLLAKTGGQTLGPFIDMPDIAFHAVKAELPADKIRHLLEALDSSPADPDIQLFKFPGIMYFRPTGQSLVDSGDDALEVAEEFPDIGNVPELPPVAAILDGVPNLQHAALKDRILFDDPDNLAAEYQPGERKHGTAMASLVIHGELDGEPDPLISQVYHLPVMQPNPEAGNREEHFPDDVFFEDRIERAVRRMLEGEGKAAAQAPTVKVINLSIGDPDRPFIHTPSPWARLLDWLSWKYRVLFCVSVGNFSETIDVNMPHSRFSKLADTQKVEIALKSIAKQLSQRRLLSPAESLNALTIGALHTDRSEDYELGNRLDLLPDETLFSPVSRFGHGFRRSIKPEILFPGGRQLYTTPFRKGDKQYFVDGTRRNPGQRVAWDSREAGEGSRVAYIRGTSNATALATRSAVRIHEVLTELREEHSEEIPDHLMAVLIKTLLVHGARHDAQAERALTESLKNQKNSRRFKEVMARYMGYGAVDIERVLGCTEQRGTVIGCGEIQEEKTHEYRLPLPMELSGRKNWRRMLITLVWFSPINPRHRNLREARLELKPAEKWDKLPLRLQRMDSDNNQVLRGTVQHEILESKKETTEYGEDGHILLHVTCKADATERLDAEIPYGLAVTLEVEERTDIRPNIPIYERIRAGIKPEEAVER
uniref:Subtilase family protein n=1 Tax=Candidatus Kentrum sp. FW TaxID=2126338 RepID=A0A450TQV7_9GAMM|nr:MAG: Subtilase family protein [Candidatus Kentron sp. FW]